MTTQVMPLLVHRCTDHDCAYLGQPSADSCACHKTREQMLAERCAELLAALRDMAMAYGHPDDPDVIEWWEHRAEEAAEEGRDSDWYRNEARARAAAAIAKAEGGATPPASARPTRSRR